MKVVAFNASPRADGNTASMLKEVAAVLEKHGIQTEIIHIGGKVLRGCTGCHRCYETKDFRCVYDDGINEYIAKAVEADGILLGSPVFFSDITAEMKAFIDRVGSVCLANNFALRRKIGASVTAVRRAGGIHSFDTMNHFFLISEMMVVGSSYWNVSIAREKGDFSHDEEGVKTMQVLGKNMAWLLKKVQEC